MIQIKEFEEKDVNQVSNIIIKNLLEINSKDYGIEKAKKMAEDFLPQKLKEILKNRKKVYVAIENGEIVGTAGIDKSWYNNDEYYILTVFVKPEKHGKKIGTHLIKQIEEYAKENNIHKLVVPASITAHNFYYKLGYRYKNGKKELNEEEMYIMEKDLK